MRRVFGVKKEKEQPPSVQDAFDKISKRGETIDDKIKRLDIELCRYKEQIKKTRPGPIHEAVKARAMRVLKQKRIYEGQRDMLYGQTFNLDQVSFAAEGINNAQQTRRAGQSSRQLRWSLFCTPCGTCCLPHESFEICKQGGKGMMKTLKIQDIDNLQDEVMDLMDVCNEIQESLGRSYNMPDDTDDEELMGELDALEADTETEADGMPSYLQPDMETDVEAELNLPGRTNWIFSSTSRQAEDELALPAVPRASPRS